MPLFPKKPDKVIANLLNAGIKVVDRKAAPRPSVIKRNIAGKENKWVLEKLALEAFSMR